ncbi:DUF397 domain-containing protein [Saccharopolyspora erythraea]|uniref:DUF397 domain-containing protein n=1 Tax=Saccharopolyspora erythraea TaxID=1836 RepID=UPI001BA6B09C|nr:DUF397 domain-containing protein [Saccharopolyspora erythraea]QUH01528.1 DUF397 domain-containing protein [Saccharopolyspora erythraea]
MTTTPAPFAEHDFRKATRSEPQKSCVRVARRADRVELRDDKTTFGAPDDHRLVFTAEQFDDFLTATRAGRTEGLCLEITRREDGTHVFRSSTSPDAELVFTEAEVDAFRDGIAKHEFDAFAYAA